MKVSVRGNGDSPGSSLLLWCPACDDVHRIVFGGPGQWTFDGDLDAPTISPSIKVGGVQWAPDSVFHKPRHLVEQGAPTTCHSFVVGGIWQFLGDCTHTLAGQNVPMVDLPDWLTGQDEAH